jgi:hypothetical protein
VNEKRGGGPNGWLLLLIPASMLMMAKARRHRMMWANDWDPAGHGFRHHAPMGGPGAEGDARGAFRLPPRLESILDAWHAKAHGTSGAAGAGEAAGAAGAGEAAGAGKAAGAAEPPKA